ncbi:MAG: hypothetical protein AABY04_03945 [Candidatus Micrarchaeota archaeon]
MPIPIEAATEFELEFHRHIRKDIPRLAGKIEGKILISPHNNGVSAKFEMNGLSRQTLENSLQKMQKVAKAICLKYNISHSLEIEKGVLHAYFYQHSKGNAGEA